jgi:serine protease
VLGPLPGSTSFSTWCGTSLAAPVVAGIAGLALSDAPGVTAASFTQALESTAVPVPGNYVAHGRVDAAATLTALGVTIPAPPLAAPRLSVAAKRPHTPATHKTVKKGTRR